MIDFETSILRWKENRQRCTRKDFFYKDCALEYARRLYKEQHPEIHTLTRELEEEFGYLLDTDSDYLLKMIEDTTPGPCHMNLSPEHDLGVPHGLWSWDPKNPDYITDEVTKTNFPNDKYPETGVLETTWGRPQKFTYYTGKTISYNRYHIYASFSGKVRFYKTEYMTKAAYNLAFLYRLTGRYEFAKKAGEILLRFADVYPYWLAHGMYGDIADMDPKIVGQDPSRLPKPKTCLPPNEPVPSIHVGYWSLGRATASGQEGGGFLLPVCITYSPVADAVSDRQIPLFTHEERYRIEKDILLEGISLVVHDTKLNNKSCSNRFAALAVGILTGVEEYIQFGKEGFHQIVEDWYLKDGSTPESASYSMMVMSSMWIAAELLDGYKGCSGKEDPIRVYEWDKYRAVWKGMYDTLLQNCQYPASADSRIGTRLSDLYIKILAYRFKRPEYMALLDHCPEPTQKRGYRYHVLPDEPITSNKDALIFRDQYFPEFGQAYLRIGKQNKKGTFILYATDWGSHHHMDSLNIYYMHNNNEWISDLGYLWDQPERYMTLRTPAHNWVIIDEADQIREGRGGDLNHFAVIPDAWKLADVSSGAYPEASLYRRAVMLCEHSEYHYILDLFTVQGGNTQDLLLHGPSMDCKIENASVTKHHDKLPYQLENPYALTHKKGFSVSWVGNDQEIFTVSVPENNHAKERIFRADGWGQRSATDVGATLPYFLRRHEGNESYTFVSIYSSATKKPFVASSICWQSTDGNMIVCEVTTKSGNKDILLYRFGTGESVVDTPYGPVSYDGTAAWIKNLGTDSKIFLYGGGTLTIGGNTWKSDAQTITGKVESYDEKGFTISVPFEVAAQWVNKTIFIHREGRKTGYQIKQIRKEKQLVYIITWDENGEGFAFASGDTWRMEHIQTF